MKGFSACFYGSLTYGFMYFTVYKSLKDQLEKHFGSDQAICYLLASFSAECFVQLWQYPFELIKCRIQSVNNEYGYRSLSHAFRKEYKTNGLTSLYKGMSPFLLTECTMVAI